MLIINQSDLDWFDSNGKKIWGYWAGKGRDGWVDGTGEDEIREILIKSTSSSSREEEGEEGQEEGEEEEEKEKNKLRRVWVCERNLPHAFCLVHGEVMAEIVGLALKSVFSDKR